ncbi:uncharacterized protein CLUP02_12405 [Colletotrichum lupini]|uniref:Uncharacterized protein n=1 Tax=Colletotrichum lupini TaxID=145971 RepID=A0A9Q8WKF0_9PEZI|nr:uncharacterized protein CLUP02_12405 [Colletotrichum lupini]UQC86903.1 hypothetical protein CLUP02_12405 [Colletotrichum lupini]
MVWGSSCSVALLLWRRFPFGRLEMVRPSNPGATDIGTAFILLCRVLLCRFPMAVEDKASKQSANEEKMELGQAPMWTCRRVSIRLSPRQVEGVRCVLWHGGTVARGR